MLERGIGVALLVSLTACTLAGEAPESSTLAGSWTLVALDVGEPLIAPALLTAEFNGDSVQGSAGCNRYRGKLNSDASGTLTVGPVAATKMACPAPVMRLEQAFMERLNSVTGYRFEAGELLLDYAIGVRRGTLRWRR